MNVIIPPTTEARAALAEARAKPTTCAACSSSLTCRISRRFLQQAVEREVDYFSPSEAPVTPRGNLAQVGIEIARANHCRLTDAEILGNMGLQLIDEPYIEEETSEG